MPFFILIKCGVFCCGRQFGQNERPHYGSVVLQRNSQHMEIFDFEILVQKLGHPIGKNKYYATLQFVYAKTESGNKDT